jgi:hypothetical protein
MNIIDVTIDVTAMNRKKRKVMKNGKKIYGKAGRQIL